MNIIQEKIKMTKCFLVEAGKKYGEPLKPKQKETIK